MTNIDKALKIAADLRFAYMAYPYTGNIGSPAHFKQQPGYNQDRHKLLFCWSSATKEARVAADLLMRFKGEIKSGAMAIDGEKLRRPNIDDNLAIQLMSRAHDWTSYTPNKADKVVREIVKFLSGEKYNIIIKGTAEIVKASRISSKKEAYNVIIKLSELTKLRGKQSGLEKGLFGSLENWSREQAFGSMFPEELKNLRKSTGQKITQQLVANELGITLRQYSRYEHGQTPVPQKVIDVINDLLKP